MNREDIIRVVSSAEEQIKQGRSDREILNYRGLVRTADYFDYSSWHYQLSQGLLVDARELLAQDQQKLLGATSLCTRVCDFIRAHIRALKAINPKRTGSSGGLAAWARTELGEDITQGVLLCAAIHSGLQWRPMWEFKWRNPLTGRWVTTWGQTAQLSINYDVDWRRCRKVA